MKAERLPQRIAVVNKAQTKWKHEPPTERDVLNCLVQDLSANY
jgi:hypothetical protein